MESEEKKYFALFEVGYSSFGYMKPERLVKFGQRTGMLKHPYDHNIATIAKEAIFDLDFVERSYFSDSVKKRINSMKIGTLIKIGMQSKQTDNMILRLDPDKVAAVHKESARLLDCKQKIEQINDEIYRATEPLQKMLNGCIGLKKEIEYDLGDAKALCFGLGKPKRPKNKNSANELKSKDGVKGY